VGTEGLLSLLVQNKSKISSCHLTVNFSRVNVFAAGNICIVLFCALIPSNQMGLVRIWSYIGKTHDMNVVCASKRWDILSIRLLPLSSESFLIIMSEQPFHLTVCNLASPSNNLPCVLMSVCTSVSMEHTSSRLG
jgi:hypothetical protein